MNKMIRNIPIRDKIVMITLLISLVIIFIFSLSNYYVDVRQYQSASVERALSDARLISQYCVMPLEFGLPENAGEALQKLEAMPYIENAVLFDLHDSVFAEYRRDMAAWRPDLPALKNKPSVLDDDHIYVCQPVAYHDQIYGYLYIKAVTDISKIEVNKILLFLFLIMCMIVLAYILASWMHKFISGNIVNLTKFTAHISEAKDYSLRIKKEAEDETGKLYDEFNRMLDTVQAREKERDEALAGLRDSESRFRTLVENAPIGITIAREQTIIYANPKFCQTLGYNSPEEVVGNSFYSYLHPEDLPAFLERAKRRQAGLPVEAVNEIRMLCKDGQSVPLLGSTALVQIEDGPARIAFLQDIAKIKQAEAELTKYRDHLEDLVRERTLELDKANRQLNLAVEVAEKANQAKSIFLTNMSHELRTPMNAIIGFSELLSHMASEPKQMDYLAKIQSSGNTLLSLINDILDLSKIEAGKLTLRWLPVNLRRLFDEMIQMFSYKIAEKSLSSEFLFSDNIPESVLIDETRLRQIIINLLGNAIKFTQSGKISVAVWAVFPEEGDQRTFDLFFSVTDTGIGIPKDHQKRIFLPFEQAWHDRNEDFGGTGLGLSITQQLVHAMNGEILVKSKVNVGSTFTVVLKSIETGGMPAGTPEAQNTAEFKFDSLDFEKATVLIADDIGFNRDLLRAYFSGYSIEIIEAENGLEALRMMHDRKPSLVLLDMKMPVMDGYEVAREMKADVALKKVPVIAVSASALHEDEALITKHCEGYLRKPVRRAELIKEAMKFLPYKVITPAEQTDREILPLNIGEVTAMLTREQKEKLLVACENADINRLRELIGMIEGHIPSAGLALSVYAARYDYDGLKKILRNCEDKS